MEEESKEYRDAFGVPLSVLPLFVQSSSSVYLQEDRYSGGQTAMVVGTRPINSLE